MTNIGPISEWVQLDTVLGARTSGRFRVQTGEGGSLDLRAGEG